MAEDLGGGDIALRAKVALLLWVLQAGWRNTPSLYCVGTSCPVGGVVIPNLKHFQVISPRVCMRCLCWYDNSSISHTYISVYIYTSVAQSCSH